MRKAAILYKGEEAGVLLQHDDGSFTFRYQDAWITDDSKPGISLTFPKKKQEYTSKYLFSFFYNMLPEGTNKQLICKHMRIDSDDYFGLLMAIARTDTIGAIRVLQIAP